MHNQYTSPSAGNRTMYTCLYDHASVAGTQFLCMRREQYAEVIWTMWPCRTSGPVSTPTGGTHRQRAAPSHTEAMVKYSLQVCCARAALQGRRAARAPRRRAASRAPLAPHVHARPAPTKPSEERAARATHHSQCIPTTPHASGRCTSKTTAMAESAPTLVNLQVAACCTAQQHSTCSALVRASLCQRSCANTNLGQGTLTPRHPPPARRWSRGRQAPARPRERACLYW